MRFIYIFAQKYFDLQEDEVDSIVKQFGIYRTQSKNMTIEEFRALYKQTKETLLFSWFDKLLSNGKNLPLFQQSLKEKEFKVLGFNYEQYSALDQFYLHNSQMKVSKTPVLMKVMKSTAHFDDFIKTVHDLIELSPRQILEILEKVYQKDTQSFKKDFIKENYLNFKLASKLQSVNFNINISQLDH